MAKLSIKPGTTSVSLYVFIGNSSVTTGAGLTGLVFNSASLVAYYVRPLGSATAITLATQTVTGAYSSGGFVEVDATNMPGVYRLDVPDAVIATGVRSAVVILKGATNMAPCVLELDLTNDANVAQISADAAAADNLETAYDDTAGAVPWAGIVDQGTAQSATGTTLVLRAAAAFADDELNGATIVITGGSAGVGQRRVITDYVGATDTATVDTWTTTPTGTITYKIHGSAPGSTGAPLPANVTQYLGSAAPALVGGRFDASTGAMAANVMTAAAAAADLTTELQSGLATQASVDTIDNFLDTEIAAILALLDDPRTEPGQGAPPVNPDLVTKIDYLYKAWRNKSTQTSSQYSLYADDTATIDQKSAVSSDGTTLTRGEVATGP